jgi:Zn-dependent peptidase ImmA (M78 family)
METFDSKLVKAVSKKREELGLSLRALSTQVGVSFSSLARIERGDGLPDNNSKIRLLEWLGPDAEDAGLTFDRVAFVHFRAMKNVQSATVHSLLGAATCLKDRYGGDKDNTEDSAPVPPAHVELHPELSKDQLEAVVSRFRSDLGLRETEPIDSLRIEVEGVQVVKLTTSGCFDARTMRRLRNDACSEWSAMSVPLNQSMERWAILLNDCHALERQRATLLEEYWHILMGHKLTKVARVAEAYGRTYDKAEEHDAYYLASATLLPKKAIQVAITKGQLSTAIAQRFGTSPELVEYRIKRLGLWREHVGKKVALKE